MSILTLQHVALSFGTVAVARDITLALDEGVHYVLIGPNGAGKTSLFNLISGQVAPDSGDILLRGKSIAGLPPHKVCRLGIARSFQVSSLFGQMTVRDNLRCAAMWQHGYRYDILRLLHRCRDLDAAVETLLVQLKLADRARTLASALSYAEQRMLEVGMALATGASVILLDEPTAGMSQSESAWMCEWIRHACAGKTLLVIEHDMDIAFRLAHQMIVMASGGIVTMGAPDDVRNNPAVRQLYFTEST